MPLPGFLNGRVELLPGVPYPAYRLAIISVGLGVAALLYLLIAKTRVGMLIRAGASNRTMLGALGVNVQLLYTFVFALGAVLAAAGPVPAAHAMARPSGRAVVAGASMAMLTLPLLPVLARHEPSYSALLTRMMILAIAAASLELILGYGGLVSFGHAAYLGS